MNRLVTTCLQTCNNLCVFTRVGSVFNDTRKVKVLSLPETIKEKSTFRAKARAFEGPSLDEGSSLETLIFPLSFQVVREPLPFA